MILPAGTIAGAKVLDVLICCICIALICSVPTEFTQARVMSDQNELQKSLSAICLQLRPGKAPGKGQCGANPERANSRGLMRSQQWD